MRTFQDPITGQTFREDGREAPQCSHCGNAYASALALAAHDCTVPAERQYVVGLPVVLTVHANGSVTATVDLSEASDLTDVSGEMWVGTADEGTWINLPDSTIDADSTVISEAFTADRITVKS